MLSLLFYKIVNRILLFHEQRQLVELKKSLTSCGQRVEISPHAIIWGTHGVVVEDDVAIHSFTHIFGSGGVHIGARTLISAGCSIASLTHPEEIADRDKPFGKSVTIEEDCWLGTGAIVLPGVRIGRGSIIGAGAVVTRDIPPLSVAVGSPARVIRQIAP